jgi:hypothetical protein
MMPFFQIGFNCQKCGFLSCNVMQFRDSLTFWRTMSPQSSALKSKLGKKKVQLVSASAIFLIGLLFSPENDGDMFL